MPKIYTENERKLFKRRVKKVLRKLPKRYISTVLEKLELPQSESNRIHRLMNCRLMNYDLLEQIEKKI